VRGDKAENRKGGRAAGAIQKVLLCDLQHAQDREKCALRWGHDFLVLLGFAFLNLNLVYANGVLSLQFGVPSSWDLPFFSLSLLVTTFDR
jgi:hypothetical protein